MSVASRICFISPPNCQGTMSSIQASWCFSMARARRMQLFTSMCP